MANKLAEALGKKGEPINTTDTTTSKKPPMKMGGGAGMRISREEAVKKYGEQKVREVEDEFNKQRARIEEMFKKQKDTSVKMMPSLIKINK